MHIVAGRHLIANLITDTNKTTDLHKVTSPKKHTSRSKITDRLITLIIPTAKLSKTLASSASWVSGVEAKLSTEPIFTIHDPINNIIFVVDTGSAVSLLPSTFNSERYYGPQDLLAVHHTQLIVQSLKNLSLYLGFAPSYLWTFTVAMLLLTF